MLAPPEPELEAESRNRKFGILIANEVVCELTGIGNRFELPCLVRSGGPLSKKAGLMNPIESQTFNFFPDQNNSSLRVGCFAKPTGSGEITGGSESLPCHRSGASGGRIYQSNRWAASGAFHSCYGLRPSSRRLRIEADRQHSDGVEAVWG